MSVEKSTPQACGSVADKDEACGDVLTPPVSRLQVLFSEVNRSNSKSAEASPLTRKTLTGSLRREHSNSKSTLTGSREKSKRSKESGLQCGGSTGRTKAKSLLVKSTPTDGKEGFSVAKRALEFVDKTPQKSEVENVGVAGNDGGFGNTNVKNGVRRPGLAKAQSEVKRKKERFSTNSDSGLLGAKELIEKALTTKERRRRRLTEQLEFIEAELQQKKGESVQAAGQVEEKEKSRESDASLNSCFSDYNVTGARVSVDTIGETLPAELLQLRHAELKREHKDLKGEIYGMTKQLSWIKRQLDATKGHARVLSKSTSDWADMMRRSQHSASLNERRKTLKHGAMVLKHSTTKRGCGARYLAFDDEHMLLLWSKSISGALHVSRYIAGLGSDLEEVKAYDVSTLSLDNVQQLLLGTEVLQLPRIRSKLTFSEDTCQRIIGFKSVVEDVQKVTLFEFCDSNTATDFYLGLRAMTNLAKAQPRANTSSPICTARGNHHEGNTPGISTPSNGAEEPVDGEEEGQIRFIAEIQKELRHIRSRQEYMNILKLKTLDCPLLLPLKSSRIRRTGIADMDQVEKDFIREKYIIINARNHRLGNHENFKTVKTYLKKRLIRDADNSNKVNYEHLCNDLLLAASRTVMEGDVFTLCHQLLSIPGRVVLCPAQTEQCADSSSTPVEIFFAAGGLITIESETSYKILGITPAGEYEDGVQSMHEWAVVKTRCIEHMSYNANEEERNIRHVKMHIQEL